MGTHSMTPSDRYEGSAEEDPAEAAWAREAEQAAGTTRLDVRPLLAAGRDPFFAIRDVADRIGPGDAFVLETPFDPAPLRRVLADAGFASHSRCLADGHWRVVFRRRGEGRPVPVDAMVEDARLWREADGLHIDVRGLEPPRPLVAILRLIDQGRADSALTAHLDRDPVYLYPELADRGWRWSLVPANGEGIRLRLARVGVPAGGS
jgi:hypothetical protein